MKRQFCFILLLEIFLLFLFIGKHVNAFAVGKIDENENQGLYNESDHVVILNITNFKSYIYNSKSSWFVEFYSTWCGHCVRFAPIWKTFASNVVNWRTIVRIAVIDCANDDNNPICREYEVMHYPTVKFFSINTKPGSLGLEIKKKNDAIGLQNDLIKQLEIEQQEGRGSSWPNIVPYRKNELETIWKAVTNDVKYCLLIFETPDSYVGTSVILDFENNSVMHIRRVTSENELLCVTAKVTKFPSLILLQRDGSQKSINIKDSTREGVRDTIKNYMETLGVDVKLQKPIEDELKSTFISHVIEKVPDADKSENSIQQFGDVVFQIDLEKALRYSFAHEISLSKIIEGEKMKALKDYLNILKFYFPMRNNGGTYLSSIYKTIKDMNEISGKYFRNLVTETENKISSVYSGNLEWIGCRGSTSTYRGYPCGLWTMFHMLTVNYANNNIDDVDYDPAKVLRAMHGYVKHFFGCAECSQHFLEMSNRTKIFDVKSEDESILWLWRAHNEVNKRLAGDSTEDPQHKKIQYPAKNDCPLCRDENNNWIEQEILFYLKKKYQQNDINIYGSILNLNNEELEVYDFFD
ncbi:sulfhydryl oxidase 2-like isoform X2 [Leptopilina boulardi]|uniref:sulfhydryl oxidase 2-like isoform X2 n=1 Tax=Leptopilina boulardi TaxID=63433 RepID=UPI0021F5FF4A|nr:sulfhydryl oxidase 2-like isoform X2 [Leptopilina boulardi]